MVSRLSLRSAYLVHAVAIYVMLGISLVAVLINYPLMRALPEDQFAEQHLSYLIRITLLTTPIYAVDIFTGFQLLRKVRDLELHSFIRGDVILLFSIMVITLIFELPSHLVLQNNFQAQAFSTVLLVNWFRVLAMMVRTYYALRMIRFFYAHDSIYDYTEFT